jgi:valyl-tRNA synthetase
VDPKSIPKHFDAPSAEKRWDESWQREKIYAHGQADSEKEPYVVDTPPPTVSGSLHIGHVFSYTHTDIMVRYHRMRGDPIFYPMGWDDNGLPTERRVQNYFHVRCDAKLPYDPDLKIEQADKKTRKEPPKLISRANFIELCHRVTSEDEKVFMDLFKRVGLSVDWSLEYATIDDRARKFAQWSFIDLFEKGHAYSVEAPAMWDIDFQTAVAQAEVEDREVSGAFHDLEFKVEGSDESFVISTTRPELLPACVGITAHPEDERFKHLFGKKAVTPVFFASVPIFPSDKVDPEKGTGILMVCTFGDATDIEWWREEKLALRQVIGRDGRFRDIEFGSEGFPSQKPETANAYYAEIRNKKVNFVKQKIVEILKDPNASTQPGKAALVAEPKSIKHPVKYFEKGDKPLEFITTRQWFVRLMDKKEKLIEKGGQIRWYPDFMFARFRDWTQNLQQDWCISRQRYFGVPFPVWYALDSQGEADRSRPLLPKADRLPIDPMSETPEGFNESQRNKPNGFTGESDVFDTWFTSSLSPQIATGWFDEKESYKKFFPASVRPQAHDIIRTWAFYTIAKSYLHEDAIPWKSATISGWILDPDRKKMSKSKGNVVTPIHLLDEFGSDSVRYWSASARLGVDTAFDQNILKVGKRLVTKIYNASKFVLSQGGEKGEVSHPLDLAFLKNLESTVKNTTEHFESNEFAKALSEAESFFWNYFTDTYLELAKMRARGEDAGFSRKEQSSAITSLRYGLNVLLRLMAPFVPYITEEVWSWVYREENQSISIHKAPWPTTQEIHKIGNTLPDDSKAFDQAVRALELIQKRKTQDQVSMGRRVSNLVLASKAETWKDFESIQKDVFAAGRVERFELSEAQDFSSDVLFEIKSIEYEENKK